MCKDCALEYQRNYHTKNKERIRQKMHDYNLKHHDEICAQHKLYYQNRDKSKDWINNERIRVFKVMQRQEVFTHYGNGKCACVRCGFDDIRALSIDHINGGGNEHRRELQAARPSHRGMGGTDFYRWLKQHDYPEGYQTLCMNCQFIKQLEDNERKRTELQKQKNTGQLTIVNGGGL